MKMKQLTLIASTFIFASHTQAEILYVKIAPGLWEHTSKTLLNGRNLESAVDELQAHLLANASPEEREILLEGMKEQGGNAGKYLECITPVAVAKGLDTEKVRQQIQNAQPNCQARLLNATAHGAKFELSCALPNGGSQKGVGEYVLKNEKEWTFHAVSSGDIQGAPAGAGKYQATVDVNAVWKGSSCGNVRPEVD
ncbi:DUF3617 domain-containing protein [Burkholderiaceae bacterium DAT-1]|nr:DUF3617 domain-containing protein [Burkholderiaceae bacterium DAT-1]